MHISPINRPSAGLRGGRPAGRFHFQYLGLQVVGTGDSELQALLAYRKAKDKAAELPAPSRGAVCTGTHPTGRRRPAQAELRALPEGFNFAYASAMAARVMRSYESNPRNIGRIEIFGQASPIQPRSYIEESFFFVSRADWERRKAAARG